MYLICPQTRPIFQGRFPIPDSASTSPLSNREGDNMKNIFVGNLDFGASEEQVRALFEAYGAVDRVSIKTDRETGRSRGFAFVEMANEAEAERAIAALNGTNLGGRALNVNEARPKTEGGGGGRPSGGGGGNRGGYGGGGGYGGDRGDRGGHGGGGGRQRREPRW
jgi:cold-inducible RNA-binding protein